MTNLFVLSFFMILCLFFSLKHAFEHTPVRISGSAAGLPDECILRSGKSLDSVMWRVYFVHLHVKQKKVLSPLPSATRHAFFSPGQNPLPYCLLILVDIAMCSLTHHDPVLMQCLNLLEPEYDSVSVSVCEIKSRGPLKRMLGYANTNLTTVTSRPSPRCWGHPNPTCPESELPTLGIDAGLHAEKKKAQDVHHTSLWECRDIAYRDDSAKIANLGTQTMHKAFLIARGPNPPHGANQSWLPHLKCRRLVWVWTQQLDPLHQMCLSVQRSPQNSM